MDQEYVVDSSGRGTHPTLASAVQDAIKTGGDATISVGPTIYGITWDGGEIRHVALEHDTLHALCGVDILSPSGTVDKWPVCGNCKKVQRSLDERRKHG